MLVEIATIINLLESEHFVRFFLFVKQFCHAIKQVTLEKWYAVTQLTRQCKEVLFFSPSLLCCH